MKSLYALLASVLLPFYMFSQEFSYSHYDSRDGMGSSTVYCVAQDKYGFLWFKNRIVTISEDDSHVVWVATTANGLIGYHDGRVVKRIDCNSGLSSNICRILYYNDGKLCVGTEKGLNKRNVMLPGYKIKGIAPATDLQATVSTAVAGH